MSSCGLTFVLGWEWANSCLGFSCSNSLIKSMWAHVITLCPGAQCYHTFLWSWDASALIFAWARQEILYQGLQKIPTYIKPRFSHWRTGLVCLLPLKTPLYVSRTEIEGSWCSAYLPKDVFTILFTPGPNSLDLGLPWAEALSVRLCLILHPPWLPTLGGAAFHSQPNFPGRKAQPHFPMNAYVRLN